MAAGAGHVSTAVAEHYNSKPTCGFDARRKSPIFRLRNFNNWVKSQLIQEATELAGVGDGGGAALDLCCGRGGDLFKWRAARVARLVCADVAAESVAEARRKFESLGLATRAAFVVADCFSPTEPLRKLHPLAAEPVDVASCQFALHYSFERAERALALLENAAACLRPGGVFVGTVPDAYELVRRTRAAGGDGSFGNDAFRVTPRFDPNGAVPLFGAEYDFHLEGVVDCPEFVVYFPALVELAKRFGLELVSRESFADYFERRRSEGARLLAKMDGLETLRRRDADERREGFAHAEHYFATNADARTIGTISSTEWEAASLYCTFMFRKRARNFED